MYFVWLKIFIVLVPIWMIGIILVKRIITEKRAEVVLPLGLIAGITTYIFILNLLSYFMKGERGMIISLVLYFLLGILIKLKTNSYKLDIPRKKVLTLCLISLIFWGVFLTRPLIHDRFGAEDFHYYSIAKTFAKGNFPIQSPWQPDLLVAYHYGGAIFLGVVNYLTNVNFDILHRIIPLLLILSCVQLLIWGWKRHTDTFSFLVFQLVPLVGLVSFGSFMLVWPFFPIQLPDISQFSSFGGWVRQLPTVSPQVDTYGMANRLTMVFYFLHQSFGLAAFFLIIFLSIYRKVQSKLFWAILGINIAALGLINESILPGAAAATFILLVYSISQSNLTDKGKIIFSLKRVMVLLIFYAVIGLAVVFQGGVTDGIVRNRGDAVVHIPITQLEAQFRSFLSRDFQKLPIKSEWMPFIWYRIDFVWLYITAIVLIPLLRLIRNRLLTVSYFALLFSAVISTIAYYLIIPKYLPSDGNRFAIIAYQSIGLAFALLFAYLLEFLYFNKKKLLKSLVTFILLWFLVPSTAPFITDWWQLRNTQNYIINPQYGVSPAIVRWIDKKIPVSDRVIDLAGYVHYKTEDFHYPNNVLQALAPYAGVLVPYWDGKYRAYIYVPGPDYISVLYSLNPSSLNKLKVSYLVIDKQFFNTLPRMRQDQLLNSRYFERVYYDDKIMPDYWIGVYKVNKEYLKNAKDIPETFDYLEKVIPHQANVFIEKSDEPFSWLQLRNAIILTLKDRTLWLYPNKGGYGYLSVHIPFQTQKEGQAYDYAVLKKETDPKTVCDCVLEKVWSGFNDQMVVWKLLEN